MYLSFEKNFINDFFMIVLFLNLKVNIMKKQKLTSKLTLSKQVITKLQSSSIRGGGTQICSNTNAGYGCPQRQTKFCDA
ncbi:hypothetical protein ATO12_12770 [Aquimarina atlantica]|uniref:Uncharacterized protein n=2 Tax=Flavobacteriaceae TaxID=49546 RepID=A0A023BYB7_9FLAO|nr:hypothetical protein ATO12_12770 [Aquimarina atlantica]